MDEPDAASVSNFFHQLADKIDIAKRTQKQLDLSQATGMNIVRDYVKPDENRISDILADLLKPDGPHGQGSAFLGLFLKQVGLSDMVVGEDFVTTREYPAGGRWIDLLLNFSRRKAVGFENKPFSDDQPNQIKDYCEHLQRAFPEGYVLYYLTRTGRHPPVYSVDKKTCANLTDAGNLRCISYQVEIRKWLEACLKECKAEKVGWLLKDLIGYIDEELGTDTSQKMELAMPNDKIQDLVFDQALKSKVNLGVACAVRQSFDAILKTVGNKFARELSASLGPEWSTIVEPDTSKGEIFRIGKKTWINSRQIDLGMWHRKRYIGVLRAQPVSTFSKDDADLSASLKSIFPSSSKGDGKWVTWWFVEHSTYRIWNLQDPELLCAMHYDTSQVVSYFKGVIEPYAETVERLMDRRCP
jgi:hypothetical protein